MTTTELMKKSDILGLPAKQQLTDGRTPRVFFYHGEKGELRHAAREANPDVEEGDPFATYMGGIAFLSDSRIALLPSFTFTYYAKRRPDGSIEKGSISPTADYTENVLALTVAEIGGQLVPSLVNFTGARVPWVRAMAAAAEIGAGSEFLAKNAPLKKLSPAFRFWSKFYSRQRRSRRNGMNYAAVTAKPEVASGEFLATVAKFDAPVMTPTGKVSRRVGVGAIRRMNGVAALYS
mgnify:CR=1 FL=1